MTVFDLSFKEFVLIIIIVFAMVILVPKNMEKPKETRIKKTLIILDKKWDKWIDKNQTK